MKSSRWSRREILQTSAALAATAAVSTLAPSAAFAKPVPILRRKIPRTGEPLPVIGTGTAWIYGFDPLTEPVPLVERRTVIETMLAGGGTVVDVAADYGPAEGILGKILLDTHLRDRLFVATKVGARYGKKDVAGALADMHRSHERMGVKQSDLLQLHDLEDPASDLTFMREWKTQGMTRYIGITTMFKPAYDAMLATLLREKPDFMQIDLALDDRSSEDRLLPAARDNGVAVIINSPFGNNRLFKAVQGRPLPPWAIDFDATTWPQFFLKFILSNPAVTCVIPGTDRPAYMLDNLEAARGKLPDAKQRQQMIRYWDEIKDG